MPKKKDQSATLSSAKVKALIGFEPHPIQQEVLNDFGKKRFTTLCWGRRSGKTVVGAYVALYYLMTSNHNIWVVAPTYDLARRIWDYLMQWVPVINKGIGQYIKINKSQYTMECYSGSKLELKSSDNPSSLLGAGLDLLVVDEAARIPEEVWRTHLRPTLSDRQGKAMFISTPYGKNWFYEMMLKGTSTDKKFEDYFYYHMKTNQNTALPHIVEEVEKARHELPANDYMQEYEAEFIEGAGSVFRGVRECLYEPESPFRNFPFIDEQYNSDHVYQGGLDLARLTDFTVEAIINKSQEKFKVVAIDRFNELDWKLQKPRMSLLSEKYRNPPINAERNNIGDAVLEDLPPNFTPFTTTAKTKKDIINNLAILIEQKKILIPNIPVVVNELEAFSYEVQPSGNIKYGAPSGYHDDIVMALALACADLKDTVSNQQYDTYITPTNYKVDNDY
jgi:hypothetical protein